MEPNTGKSLGRTCFRVQKTLDCGEDLCSNRKMTPSRQPKQHWNGFSTRMWKFLSGPTKTQTWIPLRICGNAWKLPDAVHRRFPCNLTELEQIYKEEWEEIPKSRCAKLVHAYPRRLEAVIAAKSASTKYCYRELNTYWRKTFQLLILNQFKFFSKNMFSLCHYGVFCVDRWQKFKI